MSIRGLKLFFQRLFSLLLLFGVAAVSAQPTGLLYDPEPPVDSAYVRIINASPSGVVDVWIDGISRIQKLGVGEASDYLVVAAGKHTITLHPPGKKEIQTTTNLDVIAGRATSIAFTNLRGGSVPAVFEDRANTNKLKALLSVYHLNPKVGPLDILSIDGKTKVFPNVTYGASAALSVNPIAIDLMAANAGDLAPRAKTSLTMSQGGTYSLLLLAGDGGKLIAHSVQNKIERYTGK